MTETLSIANTSIETATALGWSWMEFFFTTAGFPAKKADTLTIRPVHPDDETAFRTIAKNMSPRDQHMRFHGTINIDTINCSPFVTPAPDMVGFIAEKNGEPLGMAHAFINTSQTAEFAIMVAGNAQKQGIGKKLTLAVFNELAERNCSHVVAEVMADNTPCLKLLRACGMEITHREGIECTLTGNPATAVNTQRKAETKLRPANTRTKTSRPYSAGRLALN